MHCPPRPLASLHVYKECIVLYPLSASCCCSFQVLPLARFGVTGLGRVGKVVLALPAPCPAALSRCSLCSRRRRGCPRPRLLSSVSWWMGSHASCRFPSIGTAVPCRCSCVVCYPGPVLKTRQYRKSLASQRRGLCSCLCAESESESRSTPYLLAPSLAPSPWGRVVTHCGSASAAASSGADCPRPVSA